MDSIKHHFKLGQVPDVTPDGDVILIVGDQKARLRVYSQSLRAASRVFGAMFGPNWSDGQKISDESPREVMLPEDDPLAMWMICCVIHFNYFQVAQLYSKHILQVAIMADKYDLGTALGFASRMWLKHSYRRGHLTVIRLGYLLAAAFLFENDEMFDAHTKTLILDYSDSYMEIVRDELICQVLPLETSYLLEEARTRLRAGLWTLLNEEGEPDICTCGWGNTWNENFQRLRTKYQPIDMLEVSISEMITGIEYGSIDHAGLDYCDHSENRSMLLQKLNGLTKDFGINIDYIRVLNAKGA